MGKKGPRALHKKTLPQLQATLWPIFAAYIKRNHSPDGIYVACYTCGKPMKLGDNNTQAGHFIGRTYGPTKYEEDNVRPQCMYPCNHKHMGNGKPIEFERNLRLEIGDDVVDELKERATLDWKWDRGYLIEKIEYYKEQLKLLN